MFNLRETETSIIFENRQACCIISKKDAKVEKILANGMDITGEDSYFFHLTDTNDEIIIPEGLELEKNMIEVKTKVGNYHIKSEIYDDYFTFELVTPLPNCKSGIFAHAKYNYDYENKENVGACGIAMTFWMNPVYYPDAKSCETKGEVLPHLRDIGAKYALIIAPINEQREIIKKASLTIDKNFGILSEVGGAWGRDSRLNYGNYIIQFETKREFIEDSLSFFKYIGVDQIDFHQWKGSTMRQGDFKFERYDSPEEFKKNVVDLLEEHGMTAGLHTYSFYIRYDCEDILSKPEYQKDLGILETFTLAEDISPTDDFIPVHEKTENITKSNNFFSRSTPFVLIGEELIQFEKHSNGFTVISRGCANTKASFHKAGEKVKHIDGFYGCMAPIPGSNLFLEVARKTAEAFNRGGFSMIYLDALDGIRKHTPENEWWYYAAMFVCEIIKHCDKYPVIEYSTIYPSIWPARGRIGAYDTPWRAYKDWNKIHTADNMEYIDRYSAPTLGWYNFYPMTERFPGNEHTKYHHTDAIEHMGSLAVIYDFSVAYQNCDVESMERYAGLRRNIALYKKYDDLRKSMYFSTELLEKLRQGEWEYHLIEKADGQHVFQEKNYQSAKLYDLSDPDRNKGVFTNPFSTQTPFVRIEAMMSTANENSLMLLELNEELNLTEQILAQKFESELDLSDKLAKTVRVFGNGIKGSAIAIKTRCESNSEYGYGEYIIDTDFTGWREFILLEADNGERPDLPFDDKENRYAVYRSGLNNERITKIEIETVGDVAGIRMSSIFACEHTYEILKNPTVKIEEESIMFECELMSSDFIEYDGTTAKVIDRYGNKKNIWHSGTIHVPVGRFEAELTTRSLNRNVPRAQLTIGFTGNEIK